MTTMTLAVDDDLKAKMNNFPEINWSEVARQSFAQKVKDMELIELFKSESTLTEADALRMGREVSRAASKRLREMARKAGKLK